VSRAPWLGGGRRLAHLARDERHLFARDAPPRARRAAPVVQIVEHLKEAPERGH
jgi:hypothetical protein